MQLIQQALAGLHWQHPDKYAAPSPLGNCRAIGTAAEDHCERRNRYAPLRSRRAPGVKTQDESPMPLPWINHRSPGVSGLGWCDNAPPPMGSEIATLPVTN